MVGLAHIASGIALLISPAAADVAPLYTFTHMIGAYKATATILIAAGVMAVIGSSTFLIVPQNWRTILFIPQQILLAFHVFSISKSLITGEYPDGYIPQGGGWFVLADQIWAWVLAVSHSVWLAALVYGGRGGWKE